MADFHDWLVELRRHFHQFPELSYREEKTASKIAEVLDGLGVPYETGVGRTGVVARLEASRKGPVLGMRADMDALPISEENDVPYRSRHSGVMHACGHDGHTTITLGVIKRLVEENWQAKGQGRLLFFFQPAEEGGAGAKAMIETGILDSERMKAIFAGHMTPELPMGHIALARDVSNAASDTIHIRIIGKGGHGAYPHLCVDPIVAGAYLVSELQSIISRSISPIDRAVLTIGRFHAGTAVNIIPQDAQLDGTLRTLSAEVRDLVVDRLKELLAGLETAFRVKTELRINRGYPVLVNDSRVVEYTVRMAEDLLGNDNVHMESPRMGAEDFSYFLQKCPGVLIRLGCHDPERGFEYPLHSPRFDFDERALDVGVRLFAHLLTSYGENQGM